MKPRLLENDRTARTSQDEPMSRAEWEMGAAVLTGFVFFMAIVTAITIGIGISLAIGAL